MEKRNNHRSSFPHPISFDMLGGKGEEFENVSCRGKGVDISEGGIGMITDQTLEKGMVIRVLLPTVEGGTAVPVFSVICWSEAAGPRFRVGLQFLG